MVVRSEQKWASFWKGIQEFNPLPLWSKTLKASRAKVSLYPLQNMCLLVILSKAHAHICNIRGIKHVDVTLLMTSWPKDTAKSSNSISPSQTINNVLVPSLEWRDPSQTGTALSALSWWMGTHGWTYGRIWSSEICWSSSSVFMFWQNGSMSISTFAKWVKEALDTARGPMASGARHKQTGNVFHLHFIVIGSDLISKTKWGFTHVQMCAVMCFTKPSLSMVLRSCTLQYFHYYFLFVLVLYANSFGFIRWYLKISSLKRPLPHHYNCNQEW